MNKAERRRQMVAAHRVDKGVSETLSSAEGRAFLWWLLEIGTWGHQPYTNNALSTAFNCGKQDIANQIVAKIASIDPAGFVRMQMEQLDERSANPYAGPDSEFSRERSAAEQRAAEDGTEPDGPAED